MTHLVFLDLETTGLDPERHRIWEIAYAAGDGPLECEIVAHDLVAADPKALDLNGYYSRAGSLGLDPRRGVDWEWRLQAALKGATVVAANPAFDTSFLRARWGESPWHHRLLDIETYAMPLFGADRPVGFADLCNRLGIEFAHHSAAEDVRALRECWRELRKRYSESPA
jgi:DNA polymerase III epsilon subunit-like protein